MYDQPGVPGASRVHAPVPSEAVQRCQRHTVRSLCPDGSGETVTAVPTTGEVLPPAKLAVAAVAALLATTAAVVRV